MFSASQYLDFALYSLLCTFIGGIYNDSNRGCDDDDDYESQVYSTGYVEGANYPTLPSAGNSAEPGMILAQKW